MLYQTHYSSIVGEITIVCTDTHIVGLWFQGQKYYAAGLKEEPVITDRNPLLLSAKDWLDRYFAGQTPDPGELPLAPTGTQFQQEVWRRLLQIPYAEVTTYGQIAKEIAFAKGSNAMSAQAVGNAVGRNPISIIIPCHRVIGSNGMLTGYAGGIDRKQALLKIEGFLP